MDASPALRRDSRSRNGRGRDGEQLGHRQSGQERNGPVPSGTCRERQGRFRNLPVTRAPWAAGWYIALTPRRNVRPPPFDGTGSLSDRVIEITDGAVIDHQYGYTEFLRRRAEKSGLVVAV